MTPDIAEVRIVVGEMEYIVPPSEIETIEISQLEGWPQANIFNMPVVARSSDRVAVNISCILKGQWVTSIKDTQGGSEA